MASRLKKRAWAGLGVVVAGSCAALAFSLASCTTAPTPVPVRTFERAQRLDVVCMKVQEYPNGDFTQLPVLIPPLPQPEAKCAPVPVNVDGIVLEYHLFALVTQTSRGEVAVVDLTAGQVVDVDQSIPGYNFLVVGKNPTDIATTPDGLMTFVAAAEVNKPAIYALPSVNVLGDWQSAPGAIRPTLTSWPVCALPQAPGALAIVPTQILATPSDAGAPTTVADGGAEGGVAADAGAAGPSDDLGYQLVAVLPGDARNSAKLVTIDPRPFLRGAGVDAGIGAGPSIAPASLAPCPITSAVELAGPQYVPKSVAQGPAWDDGIKYVDGGAPPEDLPRAGQTVCAAGGGSLTDASLSLDAPESLLPRGASSALAGQVLYVADNALPIIHVIDLRSGVAKELPPLVATSITEPSRRVTATGLAISPPTREFKRYLYAIDSEDGSLIVYDVTDPDASPRTPLTRPHPETNPFQQPDRIKFTAPVATVGFARHEWPLAFNPTATGTELTGLLCNPNLNAGTAVNSDAGDVKDLGVFYRANSTLAVGPPNLTGFTGPSPFRLRGIFGFATLASGQLVAIDVDDWDAPCRRPDPMGEIPQNDGGASTDAGPPFDLPSAITPPEPLAATGDIDPYHAPETIEGVAAGSASSPVTLEAFFPVSAPHRTRSVNYLRNDITLGNNLPRIDALPQLFSNNATISVVGSGSQGNPLLIPTRTGALADPNEFVNLNDPDPKRATAPLPLPNVRFSFETPEVHFEQNWTVTFEGPIPGFAGIAGTFDTSASNGTCVRPTLGSTCVPPYETLTLTAPQGLFCRRGVEDFRLGQLKAAAVVAEAKSQGLTVPDRLPLKTSDYVQVIDDILNSGDPYWAETDTNSCWEGPLADGASATLASDRYNACAVTFGDGQDVNPDMSIQRDFPILEAYEDHLVLGRFGYPDGQIASTQSRQVVGKDSGNTEFLKLVRCCFHNQVQFNVRAANEWVTVGSHVGYMHHVMEGDGGACILSCDSRASLLNSRAPSVSRVLSDGTLLDTVVDASNKFDRNSPLALRNPMFSFVILDGAATTDTSSADIYSLRDEQWRFISRGQFGPLFINLAATTTAVSPQSMRFVESLGQLAVVDGASQGLMLIDLDQVALSHSPYF